MGYRSDVKIVFYLTRGTIDPYTPVNLALTKGRPTLPFAALKLWFDENYPVAEARDEWEAKIDYGDEHILVSYHDVKWYPSYEHIKEVEAVFEKFSEAFRSDERDHRGQFEYVRIGEEEPDIERQDSSYSDRRLFVERSILFE
jgi:hypothetical protein